VCGHIFSDCSIGTKKTKVDSFTFSSFSLLFLFVFFLLRYELDILLFNHHHTFVCKSNQEYKMMMKVPSLLLALVGFVSTVQAVRDDVMVLMYETDASLENDPSSPLYFFKQKGKVADIKTTVYGGNLGTFEL
jgi:hypothetical protein